MRSLTQRGSVTLHRWENGRLRPAADQLAAEEPLEIRLDAHAFMVTLRTPGHDDELAAGLLLSEGVITSRADLLGIQPYAKNRWGNVINVGLASSVPPPAKPSRTLAATSSCGLCGAASLAAMRRAFPRPAVDFVVSAETLLRLPATLRKAQGAFDATGGLHAAGLFSPEGKLLCAREDIGRHNAVDKIIGRAVLDDAIPLKSHVLLVSGRVSFEIVRKALAAGIGFLAAVSAPSDLAVHLARRQGMTLAGFVREARFNLYSGVRRVR